MPLESNKAAAKNLFTTNLAKCSLCRIHCQDEPAHWWRQHNYTHLAPPPRRHLAKEFASISASAQTFFWGSWEQVALRQWDWTALTNGFVSINQVSWTEIFQLEDKQSINVHQMGQWASGYRGWIEGSQQDRIFLNVNVRPQLAVALTWVTDSLNLRQSRRRGVEANGCPRQGGRLQTVNHIPMEPASASTECAYRWLHGGV